MLFIWTWCLSMQTSYPTVTLLSSAGGFVLVGILSGFSRFESKSSIRFACLFTVNETGTGRRAGILPRDYSKSCFKMRNIDCCTWNPSQTSLKTRLRPSRSFRHAMYDGFPLRIKLDKEILKLLTRLKRLVNESITTILRRFPLIMNSFSRQAGITSVLLFQLLHCEFFCFCFFFFLWF